MRDILTTKQVEETYGFYPGTLRYWRHCAGGPASFRLGRHVVYRRSEIETWISVQEAASGRGGVT